MKHFLSAIMDILFFPGLLDPYSAPINLIDSYDTEKKEKKLPQGHSIPSLDIFVFYFLLIFLFGIISIALGNPIYQVVYISFVILGIALCLGSIQANLGFVAILFGCALTLLVQPSISSSTPLQTMGHFLWPGLFVLFLSLSLYLQRLSNLENNTRNEIWRLMFGLIISLGGLVLARLNSQQLASSNYLLTVLLLAYVLAAPTKEKEKNKDTYTFKYGVMTIIGIVVFLATGFFLLFFELGSWLGGLYILLRILLYILISIGGLIVALVTLFLPSVLEELSINGDTAPVFYAEKRWALLLFYLGFLCITKPTLLAFVPALFALLGLSLSFPSLNRRQKMVPFFSFSLALTLSSVTWYCLLSTLLNYYWPPTFTFLTSPFPVYWLIFFLVGITFTLTNRHWSVWAGCILGFSLILLVNQLAAFSMLNILLSIVGFGGGVLFGYSRILFWPVLSALNLREYRIINQSEQLSSDGKTHALELLKFNCWPLPLGNKRLLSELVRRGLRVDDPETQFIKKRIYLTKNEHARALDRAKFTLGDLVNTNTAGLPFFLAEIVGKASSAYQGQGPVLEKLSAYTAVIQTITEKLEKDRYEFREKLGRDEKKVVEQIEKLLMVELKEIYASQSEVFLGVAEIAKSCRDVKHLSVTLFDQAAYQDIESHYIEAIKDLRIFINTVSAEETHLAKFPKKIKDLIKEIKELENMLVRLNSSRFNYPAQKDILLSATETMKGFLLNMEKTWWVLNANQIKILKEDDPRYKFTEFTRHLVTQHLVNEDDPWYKIAEYTQQQLEELYHLVDLKIKWAEKTLTEALSQMSSLESSPRWPRQPKN